MHLSRGEEIQPLNVSFFHCKIKDRRPFDIKAMKYFSGAVICNQEHSGNQYLQFRNSSFHIVFIYFRGENLLTQCKNYGKIHSAKSNRSLGREADFKSSIFMLFRAIGVFIKKVRG